MHLLLDTHILLWWIEDNRALGAPIRRAIGKPQNSLYVSVASIWEIEIKRNAGKLRTDQDWTESLAAYDAIEVPITKAHALEAARLPRYHFDPFDRMLIAQARLERLTLVTADAQFAKYDIELLSQ